MLAYFLPIWSILWLCGLFCSYVVYFVATWSILWLFGILLPFWYVVPRKIWQPWIELTESFAQPTGSLSALRMRCQWQTTILETNPTWPVDPFPFKTGFHFSTDMSLICEMEGVLKTTKFFFLNANILFMTYISMYSPLNMYLHFICILGY
jgi:hypothetical protein